MATRDLDKPERAVVVLPPSFFQPPPGMSRLEFLQAELWKARLLKRHGGVYSVGFCESMIRALHAEIEREAALF